HGGSFTVGAPGSYVLTVVNVGSGATTDSIRIADALPAGLTFSGGAGAGWVASVTGAEVRPGHAGPVGAGDSLAVTLTVNVAAAAVPSVINSGIASTAGDPNPGNDSASDSTVVLPPSLPDLQLAKRHSGSFTVGAPGSYVLTVVNVGN